MLFSEPKIPQFTLIYYHTPRRSSTFQCSSASRKFLNDEIVEEVVLLRRFQCSSASRKFLNKGGAQWRPTRFGSFSALQRAENSSMPAQRVPSPPSVIVSVLFSEPKIPQCRGGAEGSACGAEFQCSSASRKFLNEDYEFVKYEEFEFQCSSASRKFLNIEGRIKTLRISKSFSALQRAENSSIERRSERAGDR